LEAQVLRTILVSLVFLLVFTVAPSASRLDAEGIVFQTDMYGTENIPPVTTVSYGFVRFFFNDDRSAAEYNVDVKGYDGGQVLGADIHRGARGVNGPAVKHLADGGFIVTGGRTTFSEQDLKDMAAGLWYVSLKSVDHPEGALRGQIVLPAGFSPGSSGPPAGIPPLPGLPVEGVRPAPPAPAAPIPVVPSSPPPEAVSDPSPTVELDTPAPVAIIPAAPPAPPVTAPAPASPPVPIFRPPNTGSGGLRN
jgi:hypothetical protein